MFKEKKKKILSYLYEYIYIYSLKWRKKRQKDVKWVMQKWQRENGQCKKGYEKLRIKMAKEKKQLKLKFKRCHLKSCIPETLNLLALGLQNDQ